MISIKNPGGYNCLEYIELDKDQHTSGANYNFKKNAPNKDDSVVVQTFACGVNYADVCIRWGIYNSAKEFVGWPITPGFEFSGEVIETGKNVTKFQIGDKVLGITLFGGYSKRILVPEAQMRHIPEEMTKMQAAGFITVALTAWYAMFECCKLRKRNRVLVHSAAGGVGSMLVQMGKIAGCHVTGVVGRSSKVDFLEKLGCDVIIDKSAVKLWEAVDNTSEDGKFEAIFDANGLETLNEGYKRLAPGGRLIVYGHHTLLPKSDGSSNGAINLWNWMKVGWNVFQTPKFSPLQLTEENKSVMGFNLSFMIEKMEVFEEAMADLLRWVKEERLKVAHVTEYPLREVARAHEDIESGNTVGKLVLVTRE